MLLETPVSKNKMLALTQALAASAAKKSAVQETKTDSLDKRFKKAKTRIDDLGTSIDDTADYLETASNDIVVLDKSVERVIEGNRALKNILLARNPRDLDVFGVFSEFRIPSDLDITDLSGSDLLKTLKVSKFAYDSSFRATLNNFVRFAQNSGFALKSGVAENVNPVDLAVVLAGIRAARLAVKKYGVTDAPALVRVRNDLKTEITEYETRLAELSEKRNSVVDKTVYGDKPKHSQDIKHLVKPTSIVEKKRQDLDREQSKYNALQTDVTKLGSKIKLYQNLGNATVQDVKSQVSELENDLKDLIKRYHELEAEYKVAKRSDRPGAIRKTLDRQEELFQRKRAEQENKLVGKYGRLSKPERQKRVDAEMKAWDRVERAELVKRNKEQGRDVVPDSANTVKAKLDSAFSKITEFTESISMLKQAASRPAQDRKMDQARIAQMLSQKKAELKKTAKRIATRKAAIESEIDFDLWESRVEERFEADEKFVRSAKRYAPLVYIRNAIRFGSDNRSKEVSQAMWRYFKMHDKQQIVKKTLKQKLVVAPVHFGKDGFVIDPRYLKHNAELVAVLQYAVDSAIKAESEKSLRDSVLYALLDALKQTPESMLEHKAVFNKSLLEVNRQLVSPKLKLFVYEVVEEMVQAKKIDIGTVNPNKRQIESFVDTMLTLIRSTNPLKKLAAITWARYREEVTTWAVNAFKIEKKGR